MESLLEDDLAVGQCQSLQMVGSLKTFNRELLSQISQAKAGHWEPTSSINGDGVKN